VRAQELNQSQVVVRLIGRGRDFVRICGNPFQAAEYRRPDPARGEGFWFVDVSRGRSASLGGGIKGHAIRGRAEKESLKGLKEGMQLMKSALERKTG